MEGHERLRQRPRERKVAFGDGSAYCPVLIHLYFFLATHERFELRPNKKAIPGQPF
jgi:hypothetical protein